MKQRFLPLVLAAVPAVAVVLIAPEIVTGTFSDLETFLRAAAFTAAIVGWVVTVRRWVRPPNLAGLLTIVPVLAALWLVLWPYVRPATEVDEAFPVVVAPTSTTTTLLTTTPTTTTPTATTPPATTPPATTLPTTTVAAGPVELRRAAFQGLTGHRGSGDAVLYRQSDGTHLLRFEEIDIGSGPDLEVYLVPGADQRGTGGATHVAPLTAERGNQNYEIPDSIDITDETWTVLVWCETFAVEVANATLA